MGIPATLPSTLLSGRWNGIGSKYRNCILQSFLSMRRMPFAALFLLGSRINHWYTANVNSAYNSVLENETFHAMRDIVAGEELTIMYINGTNRIEVGVRPRWTDGDFATLAPACEDTLLGRERERKSLLSCSPLLENSQ
jgi:hypothetical protein